jgi:hypothetical protein
VTIIVYEQCFLIIYLFFNRQYNGSHPGIEINPYFLHFIPKKTPKTFNKSQFKHIHTLDLDKESLYHKQSDPLFSHYLYCSIAIWVAIMIIRFLTLFDEIDQSNKKIERIWLSNGSIICYVTLLIIALSLGINYFMKHQVSKFRLIITSY